MLGMKQTTFVKRIEDSMNNVPHQVIGRNDSLPHVQWCFWHSKVKIDVDRVIKCVCNPKN